MTWTHIIVGITCFFAGGFLGVFAMALCAMAGREVEIDSHE